MEEEIDSIPFDKSDWIGKGRLYPKVPKDIPLGLSYYCDAQRKLPDSIVDEWIPGPLVTVKAFVNSQGPKIRHDLTSIKAQDSFSKLLPHDIGNRHCSITDSSNITAVSNIAIQVYEHRIGTDFRDVPHSQPIRISRFDFIRSAAFLCTLKSPPRIIQDGIKITVEDWDLFKDLDKRKEKVLEVLKRLVGRQKGSVDSVELEDGEE